eukprot:1651102-Lingulodinium_polyedra.AAC.1
MSAQCQPHWIRRRARGLMGVSIDGRFDGRAFVRMNQATRARGCVRRAVFSGSRANRRRRSCFRFVSKIERVLSSRSGRARSQTYEFRPAA